MTTKKIALFIDADNISAKFGKRIIGTLESRGEIFIRRIYGNWEKFSLHGWKDCIKNFSLRAVQQTDFVAGKNATDLSLTIDAMDVLHDGKAEIFVLVSNDSDFTPLAIRLREGGRIIIGMGNANAANTFRAACNEFIDLDACAAEKVAPPPKPEKKNSTAPVEVAPVKVKSVEIAPVKVMPVQMSLFDEENISQPKNPKVVSISDRKLQSERDKKIQQLHNILHELAANYGDDNGFFLLTSAGQAIKRKRLGFGVRDFGFHTLQHFVDAFPKLYEVQKHENIAMYRCRANEQKVSASPEDDKLRQIHDILRETATEFKDLSDAGGLTPLNRAGQNIHERQLTIKGLGYSSLSKFVSGFPNLYELHKTETNFYYRCK